MNKPIEPGCLALVISGPNAGESCEVICWVGDGDDFPTSGGEYTNVTGVSGWAVDFGDGCGIYLPGRLRRIDGDAESAESHAERRRKGVPA